MSAKSAAPKKQGGPMGHGPVQMSVEKPKNFKGSIVKLVKSLKQYKVSILAALVLAIIGTGFAIVSPKILGNMTNQIVDDYVAVQAYDTITKNLPAGVTIPDGTTVKDLPDLMQQAAQSGQLTPDQIQDLMKMQENSDDAGDIDNVPAAQVDKINNLDLSEKPVFHYDVLAEIALTLVVLYILSAICSYIGGWLLTGMTQKLVLRFRRDISQKINRLPIKYFDKHPYGDTLSRVTNDVDTIAQTLNQSLSQIVSSVTMVIGILIMMLTISWVLTIIAIVVLPVSMLFIMFITKKSQKHFRNQQNQLGELNGHIEETYAGQTVVKAFSAEARAAAKFDKTNQRLYTSAWKAQFLSGLMMPIMNLISNLGYVATAMVGGWLAINGRISIGDIQAFIQYVQQFNQPIAQAAQIANVLQSTVAAAERVFEFLEEPEETPDVIANVVKQPSNNLPGLPRRSAPRNDMRGEVEFKNVKFSYEPGKPVIKNFSAHIKPGQKVAIVGPTGAGKTTLVNLLMRFYDPDSGTISIDGTNTRDMKRADVRNEFGMVLQDTWLFNGTIAENLAYGDLTASKDDLMRAAQAAHVDHFVQSLPDGYDTMIGEDSENISAGEKQLLTIARAMLADAPMLILDEATSSVDTRTEILIQQAMEKLMHGRTSFVIAHRLSTIVNSDLILVMDDGNIVEQGTHHDVLKQGGFYAKLYNSQFTAE
ncbi:ABC transporter [Alphaproteobacteria bacterium]|nr:ABC transporter [Alphaproteobacteria bacterium]